MAEKYHITKKGTPGLCRAQKNCPLGGDAEHYDSKKEATKAFEHSQSSGVLPRAMRNLDSMSLKTLKLRAATGIPSFYLHELGEATQTIETIHFIPFPEGHLMVSENGDESEIMHSLDRLGIVKYDSEKGLVSFTKLAKDELEVLDLLGEIKVDFLETRIEEQKAEIVSRKNTSNGEQAKHVFDLLVEEKKIEDLPSALHHHGFGNPMQTRQFVKDLKTLRELKK